MKLQIDTDKKVVKIDNSAKIKDILDTLKKILPDYEDYILESNTTIVEWEKPIYIPKYVPYQPYWYRTNDVWLECKSDNATLCVDKGIYNIEC